jgi:hypothetical protein
MKVENLSIESLVPYARNPRKNDDAVKSLAASIKEFGWQQPIVVDKDKVVVAGHTRLKAAQALGMKQVPCVVASDLTPEQIKAYRILDNKLAEKSHWDLELLDLEIKEIDFDFEPFEVEFEAPPEPEVEIVEDEVPEPPVEPITKTGDLWLLGEHRVLCGDSTRDEDVGRLMTGETVAAVITDPPYGISVVKSGMVGADFGVAKKGNYQPVIGDESPPNIKHLLSLCDKAIVWGGNYFADQLPVSGSWLIWDKRGDTGIENTFADCELAWSNMGGPARIYRQLWNGMIREKEKDKRTHPTQKPVLLMSWCIEKEKDKGTILDPFLGSGTTLIAAEQLGRKCYGMEIGPQYCDVIVKRWENLTGKKAVLSDG